MHGPPRQAKWYSTKLPSLRRRRVLAIPFSFGMAPSSDALFAEVAVSRVLRACIHPRFQGLSQHHDFIWFNRESVDRLTGDLRGPNRANHSGLEAVRGVSAG